MSTDTNEPVAEAEEHPEALGSWDGTRPRLKKRDFILSSRRLWLLSMSLYQRGHPRLAGLLKNVNSMMYHNSLPVEANVSPDVRLGHHGFGTVLHPRVVIGPGVKIFQNVTMAVRPPGGTHQIVIEEGAVVGANAVIMTPRHRSIRIGRGARVGAGAVVTHDVPAMTIAISAPVELRERKVGRGGSDSDSDSDSDS
jgi:serine O-acetyltransferase